MTLVHFFKKGPALFTFEGNKIYLFISIHIQFFPIYRKELNMNIQKYDLHVSCMNTCKLVRY